jgi:hypothetical protein
MIRRRSVHLALASMMSVCACAASDRLPTRELESWRGVLSETAVNMIVVVSSQCREARTERFRTALRSLAAKLEERARREGKRLVTIGVSLDVRLDDGIAMLAALGTPFSEVSVGSSWLNGAAQTFLWEGVPGIAAIPQVVVVERTVTVRPSRISFGPYTLVSRLVGAAEIEAQVRGGDSPQPDGS